ncbi:MAG: InlB B-repeat-containing protein [Treponema sp.]|jgi:uncharacterized repeat protein (TIGR02543 family)|nr:InlB B-repeat-containing protein [Treponema sp.]
MKKFYKLLGVIAIGAVIAIGMAGCDTGSGSDSDDYQQGSNTGDNTGGNNTGDNNGGNNTGGGTTTYTVTFNGNGGSSPSSKTVNAGSSTMLPSITRSGYTLNGWYTASSGGTKAGNAGASYTPSADITLYAQWSQSGGGGTTTTEYRIDQAIFGSCSKSGNNLVFNWTLKTTGKTPNGLYTYTSPSSIVVSVQVDGSYQDLETLAGSARRYTLNNFAAWAADDRVYFRVKCVSNYNETISYNGYRVTGNTFTPNYPN